MLCCVLAILLVGPLGLAVRAMPGRSDCCARRRLILGGSAAALLIVGVTGYALMFPGPFRHICRFPYALTSSL